MTDAVYRQWLLLRRIPREPRRASIRELWQALSDTGHGVTKRTVERDLLALSAQFGITCDQDGAATQWYWPRDASALDVPGLDPAGALALVLAQEHVEPLLPTAAVEQLTPYLRRAREVLEQDSGRRLGAWRRKVRIVSRGPSLLKPQIAPQVHAAIADALLRECLIEAEYRGKHAEGVRRIVLAPLGLVAKHDVLYLVATSDGAATPFQYALHRFVSATSLDQPATPLRGFSMDRYVDEEMAFGYPHGSAPIRLIVDFEADAAIHLRERPLSTDQTLVERDDGRMRLSATVTDTEELRWWLLGFGPGAEVVAPVGLRKEFRRMSKRMAGRYRSS